MNKKILKNLYSKQFMKYFFVGGMYTLTGLIIFWYFADILHISSWLVFIIWTPLSFMIRFIFDRYWVFELK